MPDWINIYHPDTGGTAEVTQEAQDLVYADLGWQKVTQKKADEYAEAQEAKMERPEGEMTQEEAIAAVYAERGESPPPEEPEPEPEPQPEPPPEPTE